MGLIKSNPPSGKMPKRKLTQEDVWGTFDENHKLVSRGMIVARGFSSTTKSAEIKELEKELQVKSICPVWKDKLPYKSVTIICDESQFDDVTYWIMYVHGGDCISKRKNLPDGKLALRSDYQCW